MWTVDLDNIESCDFHPSLLNFESIDSISDYATTDTFAYMKSPNVIWASFVIYRLFLNETSRCILTNSKLRFRYDKSRHLFF